MKTIQKIILVFLGSLVEKYERQFSNKYNLLASTNREHNANVDKWNKQLVVVVENIKEHGEITSFGISHLIQARENEEITF